MVSKDLQNEIVKSVLLDDSGCLTLADISRACSTHAEWVIELVDEGILEPIGTESSSWRFNSASLTRARITHRLQTDLGVNLAGAALVIDMMEELEALRRQINELKID